TVAKPDEPAAAALGPTAVEALGVVALDRPLFELFELLPRAVRFGSSAAHPSARTQLVKPATRHFRVLDIAGASEFSRQASQLTAANAIRRCPIVCSATRAQAR